MVGFYKTLFHSIILRFSSLFFTVASSALLARMLTAESAGIYFFIMATKELFFSVSNFGIGPNLNKDIVNEGRGRKDAINFFIGFILFTLFILLSLVTLLVMEGVSNVNFLIGLLVTLALLNAYTNRVLNALFLINFTNIIMLLGSIINLSLLLFFYFKKQDSYEYALSVVCFVESMQFVSCFIFFCFKNPIKVKIKKAITIFPKLYVRYIKASKINFFILVFSGLSQTFPVLYTKYFFAYSFVAELSFSLMFVRLVRFFAQTVASTLFPFSALGQGGKSHERALYMGLIVMGLSLFLLLPIYFFDDLVVSLLFGKEYEHITKYVLLLTLSSCFSGFSFVANSHLVAVGRDRLAFKLTCLEVIAGALSIGVLAYFYMFDGVILGVLVASAAVFIHRFLLLYKFSRSENRRPDSL